jgi:hypothetical protein
LRAAADRLNPAVRLRSACSASSARPSAWAASPDGRTAYGAGGRAPISAARPPPCSTQPS